MSYPDLGWEGEFDLHDRLEVSLSRVGALTLGANWRHADLAAPYWRLYANHDDGARIQVHGRRPIDLRRHRRYLIPPWVHFAGESGPGVRHVFCHFEVLGLSGMLIREVFPLPLVLDDDHPAVASYLGLGDTLAATRRTGPRLACAFKAAIYTALAEAIARLPAAHEQRLLSQIRRDLPVREALDWIEAHLGEDCSNAAIATRMRVGSDQCIRRFRRWLGQTPAEYVQERRVAAAARDLAYGDDPIDTIATRYGFPNRHYFSRVFARRMGQPPAAYRRAHGI